MAEKPVRVGLDDETTETYRAEAARRGQTLEEFLTWFLKETVSRGKQFDALRNGRRPGGIQ